MIPARRDLTAREQRRALALLSKAAWRLATELAAAGDDEERANPHLRSMRRLETKIRTFLEDVKEDT